MHTHTAICHSAGWNLSDQVDDADFAATAVETSLIQRSWRYGKCMGRILLCSQTAIVSTMYVKPLNRVCPKKHITTKKNLKFPAEMTQYFITKFSTVIHKNFVYINCTHVMRFVNQYKNDKDWYTKSKFIICQLAKHKEITLLHLIVHIDWKLSSYRNWRYYCVLWHIIIQYSEHDFIRSVFRCRLTAIRVNNKLSVNW